MTDTVRYPITDTCITKSPVKVIIDQDGGSDDFVALLYAFMSNQFDVKGINVVAGNTGVYNVLHNTYKALDMAGITPDKAKEIGIHLPEKVNRDIISDGAHGDNGLGGIRYEVSGGYEPDFETAEDFLVRAVSEEPGEIYILAIGPLTNIANALEKDPMFAKKVKGLVIMGGDEGGGNITPYAEFNIYSDSKAAKKVFEAGFTKLTMIGFNQSKFVTLCPEVESFLRRYGGEMGKFIYDITRVTAELDRKKNAVDGAAMNDVLTFIYLLYGDSFFSCKKATVSVEISDNEKMGQTKVLPYIAGKATCDVVTGIEIENVLREVLTVIFPGEQSKINGCLVARKDRLAFLKRCIDAYPEKATFLRNYFSQENVVRNMV